MFLKCFSVLLVFGLCVKNITIYCDPICSKPCGNGTCIDQDQCYCDDGYTFENGTCSPICIGPCGHGYCAEPYTCHCDPGYDFELDTCVPRCSQSCGVGKCTAPGICECDSGYKYINSCDPTCCQAYCSKPCINGVCSLPEVCTCNYGYVQNTALDNDTTCFPYCGVNCGNGTCVAPDTCSCSKGYLNTMDIETQIESDTVCIPICKNCEGKCIAPNVCETESKNEDIDGGKITETNSSTTKSPISYEKTNTKDVTDFSAKNQDQSSSATYVVVGLVVVLVSSIIITVLIKRRHSITKCFRKDDYIVEEDWIDEGASKDAHSMDVLGVDKNAP